MKMICEEMEPEGTGNGRVQRYRPPFVILDIGGLSEQRRGAYIVKGVIHKGDLGVIYGSPAAGKSFLAFDLMARVASGRAWNDFRVRRGNCLYVGLEGQNGLERRFNARIENEDDTDASAVIAGVRFVIDPLDLLDDESVDLFITAARDCNPDLVIIDPFQNAIAGESDSESCTVSSAVRSCKRIASELECAVLLVHHAQKANARVERGSSALRASCDFMLLVEDGTPRKLKYDRLKDGRAPDPDIFVLADVALGVDDEGDAIASARVEFVPRKPKASTWNLGKNPESVLQALRFSMDEGQGLTAIQLREEAGLPTSSVYCALNSLIKHSFVQRSQGKPSRYWSTEAGRSQLDEDDLALPIP